MYHSFSVHLTKTRNEKKMYWLPHRQPCRFLDKSMCTSSKLNWKPSSCCTNISVKHYFISQSVHSGGLVLGLRWTSFACSTYHVRNNIRNRTQYNPHSRCFTFNSIWQRANERVFTDLWERQVCDRWLCSGRSVSYGERLFCTSKFYLEVWNTRISLEKQLSESVRSLFARCTCVSSNCHFAAFH